MQKAQSTNSYIAYSESTSVKGAKGGVPVLQTAVGQYVTPTVSVKAMAPYPIKGQPALVEPNFFDELEKDEVDEVVDADVAESDASYSKVRKKGFSFSSALVIILAVVAAFVGVAGKFISSIAEYCVIADGSIAYIYIESLISNITSGVILSTENIIPLCVALVAVFSALSIIACIVRIGYKGVCIFAKITTLLALIFSGVALGYAMGTGITVGMGLYIICGITFVQSVIALCAKRYKNCKKELKA